MNNRKKRKNKKILFNEDHYIKEHYIKDGKAIIPIELKNPDDLYMEHDYLKLELSDSVCKYIEEIAYMIPIDEEIVLDIHCPKIDKQTQERMSYAIKNNYGGEIDDLDYDMKINKRKSFILLLIGIILLIINIITEQYINSIISNFLCVLWWVAIWDVIEVIIFDNRKNRINRLNHQQLYDAEIKFTFKEDK